MEFKNINTVLDGERKAHRVMSIISGALMILFLISGIYHEQQQNMNASIGWMICAVIMLIQVKSNLSAINTIDLLKQIEEIREEK